jgi:hypothetical protein
VTHTLQDLHFGNSGQYGGLQTLFRRHNGIEGAEQE